MDDEKLMQEIDAAYMRAKHGKAYLGDEMGKAIASGQKASHAANEWMMLRAEARKRGLIPDLGVRADLAQAPAPVLWTQAQQLAFARAYDTEDAAQRGEPTPWVDGEDTGEWVDERVACVRAGLAALEAPNAGVVAELVEAAKGLEKAATEVSRRGAETGPQWTKLTVALLQARAAIAKLTPALLGRNTTEG